MFEICKLSAPNLNSIWDIQNYSEIFGDLMFVNSDKLEVQRLYSMDLFKKRVQIILSKFTMHKINNARIYIKELSTAP